MMGPVALVFLMFAALVLLAAMIGMLIESRATQAELRKLRHRLSLLEAHRNADRAHTAQRSQASPMAAPAAPTEPDRPVLLEHPAEPPTSAVEPPPPTPLATTAPFFVPASDRGEDDPVDLSSAVEDHLDTAPPVEAEAATDLDESESLDQTVAEKVAADERARDGWDDDLPVPTPMPASHGKAMSFSLEEMLGAKLSVWVGAITLAIAGAWFVKYAFDRRILTASICMTIAAAFGGGMIGAAQFLFRRAPRIANGLAAAGTAVLFTTVWASVNMFALFGSQTGFAAMALITAAAVVLSLRHGPFVALLGLVGGFVTPVLMRSSLDSTGQVFSYLFLLQVALVALTRRRGWHLLGILSLAAGLAWAAYWVFYNYEVGDTTWLSLYLLGTAGAFVLASLPGADDGDRQGALAHCAMGWVGAVAAIVLMGALSQAAGFSDSNWVYYGILGIGCVVLARIDERYLPLAVIVIAASAVMLGFWRGSEAFAAAEQMRYLLIVAIYGGMYSVAGYICLWRAARPDFWAAVCAVSAAAYFLLAFWGVDRFTDASWSGASVALAAAIALAAVPVYRKRAEAWMNHALAILALGAAAFVALAVPIALEEQWLTVAWALFVPLVVLIEGRLRVSALRLVALIVSIFVAVRLTLNPLVLWYPIGDLPILNWLLYGYGVPMVAFALAACLYHRIIHRERAQHGDVPPFDPDGGRYFASAIVDASWMKNWLIACTTAFAFVLVTLETRHYFHRAEWLSARFTLIEMSTFLTAWLLLGWMFISLASKLSREVMLGAVGCIVVATLIAMMLGPVVGVNPVITGESVGETVGFNWLLYGYGLPAVIAALTAYWLFRIESIPSAFAAFVVATVMMFMLVSLEVRHGFHAGDMSRGEPSFVEWATYVIAWMLLAMLVYLVQARWQIHALRHLSYLICGLALAVGAMMVGVFTNPLLSGAEVGATIIWNWLLYAYGLPVVLFAVFGVINFKMGHMTPAYLLGLAATTGAFLLISLLVRQAYHGQTIGGSEVFANESYTYSAAWGVYGLLLVIGGIAFGFKTLRWSSLVVMMLTVGKVFMVDTRHLEDLWRVFSFLGLGVTLMILGYLYQRFVFRDLRLASPPAEESRPSI